MERKFWFSRSLRAAERGHSHNNNNLIGYGCFHMLLFLLSTRYVLHPPYFLITLITSYMESPSQLLSACLVKLAPHRYGFLLHYHHQPPPYLLPSTTTISLRPLVVGALTSDH